MCNDHILNNIPDLTYTVIITIAQLSAFKIDIYLPFNFNLNKLFNLIFILVILMIIISFHKYVNIVYVNVFVQLGFGGDVKWLVAIKHLCV